MLDRSKVPTRRGNVVDVAEAAAPRGTPESVGGPEDDPCHRVERRTGDERFEQLDHRLLALTQRAGAQRRGIFETELRHGGGVLAAAHDRYGGEAGRDGRD